MNFSKFVAEVSAMDLRLAEGSVAYTLWRNSATGAFENGVVPLGGLKYIAIQVDFSGKIQLRGYRAEFDARSAEVVIGGKQRNDFVHDLNGQTGEAPRGESVLFMAKRMLQQMAAGAEMAASDVTLPEVLVEFPVDTLRERVRTQALANQAGTLRRGMANNINMRSLIVPISGRVIRSWVAEGQPEWTWYCIQTESGETYDMVLPTQGQALFQMGGEVQEGNPIFRLTTETPQAVAEDLVWNDAQQTSKCGMYARIPLELCRPLVREGHVPVNVFEDVSLLLGAEGPDISQEVRMRCHLERPVGEFGTPERNRALATGKALLGGLAAYATNEDILSSLDGGPVQLSGMPVVQNWVVCKFADLQVKSPTSFANFGGLRRRWEAKYGVMDPSKVPAARAHAVLEAAEAAAKACGEFNAATAAQVLAANGGPEHAVGVLNLLAKHGTPEASQTYLEAVHGQIDVSTAGAPVDAS